MEAESMKTLGKLSTAVLIAIGMCFMTACGNFTNPGDYLGGGGIVNEAPEAPETDSTVEKITGGFDTDDTSADSVTDWQSAEYTAITLADGNVTVSGGGAQYSSESGADVVTITEADRIYVLTGRLSNGRIYVDNVNGNLTIVLSGVDISSSDGAAIAVFGKKKKVITLAEGTSNSLADASNYSAFYNDDGDEPNGALFSKKALTINGSGYLTVTGNYNNGISCKDELKILGGNVSVTAVNNAIKGNDNVIIKNAAVTVTSDGDGIKTDNTGVDETTGAVDESVGNFYAESSTIIVTAAEDGIQADRYLRIVDGTFNIVTGGGSSANSGISTPNSRPDDWSSSQTDSTSRKGIKSGSVILVEGGDFTLDCYDDAVHSDGYVIISGGNLGISTGDDAVHADEVLTVSGGVIDVSKCYEGLEAARVTISGGEVYIVADDDGINAADGTSNAVGSANPDCSLIISGGIVYVNSAGDGLDSNGTLLISGGTVYVDGPTSGADAALDSDGGILINGGTLVTCGTLGMIETPATNSEQYCVSYAQSSAIAAGTRLAVRDSSGNELIGYINSKACQSLILSCGDFKYGESYTIYSGNTALATFTISSTVTSVGSSANSGAGGNHGNTPNRPGGGRF